jgi:hypothetical protein
MSDGAPGPEGPGPGSGDAGETGSAGKSGDAGESDSAGESSGAGDSGGSGESGGAGESGGSGESGSAAEPGEGAQSGAESHAHGAYLAETPEQLLREARDARRRARRARHAYWFPLVLFGILTCASIPFYLVRFPGGGGFYSIHGAARYFSSYYLGGFGFVTGRYLGFYWLAAMLVGLAATAVWYRVRGDRVGLRTPSRGFVITGLVLVVLALLIPILAGRGGVGPLYFLMPGDLLVRGTFPLVLIGIGLWVLAWAERSIALTVIAAGYLALSLVASLYDIENVFYRLGWNLSPQASRLPNVVLPALVLLLSGAGAWVVQRRRGPRPTGPVADGGIAATGQA